MEYIGGAAVIIALAIMMNFDQVLQTIEKIFGKRK